MDLGYQALKARQRRERENHREDMALRVHRALSWLNRAEQCEDTDGRFIFLWIAFNAAYANDMGDQERLRESELFGKFLGKLIQLDRERVLYNLIWKEFSGPIRLLLENRYVFQPFWDFHNDKISEAYWQQEFRKSNEAARTALAGGEALRVLCIVLARMYTLRNQLVHGGATWDSRINRDQLRDCTRFLGKLVPFIITLMMDNPDALWGRACYPVVDAEAAAART